MQGYSQTTLHRSRRSTIRSGTRKKKGYQEYGDNGEDDDDDDDDDDEENVHRLRSAPMQGGRAAIAAPSFTMEAGPPHGYEGGGSGRSHPENADPDQ